MNLRKTITLLIVGLAIMGFTSICMAFSSTGGGGTLGFEGFGFEGSGFEEPGYGTDEEEETVAEAEPEAPPMEEEEYTEEERVVPVAVEGEEEVAPDIY